MLILHFYTYLVAKMAKQKTVIAFKDVNIIFKYN